MTVGAITPFAEFTITGIGPYGFRFSYNADAIDVAVEWDGMRISLPAADFSMTPTDSDTGGNLYLTPAAAATHATRRLIVRRDTEAEQGWAGIQGAREKGLERQLDRIVRRLQENTSALAGTLRVYQPLDPFVPLEGRTILFEDGRFIAGPTADQITEAQQFADDAAAAAASSAANAAGVKPRFANLAEATGGIVAAPVGAVELDGRNAAGDGGKALYVAVGSQPSHPFKFQTADSRWWEISTDGDLRAEMFGVGLGATDDRVLMQAMYDLVGQREVKFFNGPYNFPTPAGYDVYLMAGDDWMNGNNIGPVDPVLDATESRILQYSYDNSVVKLASQPFESVGATINVSPGLNFAKQMLTKTPANRGIILVPNARVWENGIVDWVQGGPAYTSAITGINAALSYGGGTNRLVGVIYAGGFFDIGLGTSEATFGTHLDSLMTGLRADIAGAARAKLVCAQFITEFAAGNPGLAVQYAHKHTLMATSAKALTGYQESGHRTNAAGSRLLGTKMAEAMLENLPYDFGDQFFTINGFQRKAHLAAESVFVPTRPQNMQIRFDRSNAANLTDTRGFNLLWEQGDYLRAQNTKDQWPGNLLCTSHFAVSREWGVTALNSPQTTLHGYSIGLPGGNGNVGGSAACTIILGEQNGWGHVTVVSNSRNSKFPEGNPTSLIGHEIDVQPATGSNLTSGAGLLVNCFTDPVEFAGVAVVGDGGGSFQDAVFVGNCTRYGMYVNNAFAGSNGLHFNDATFADSAISLGAGATNGITITSAGITSNIYKETGTGALVFENGATTSIRNGTTEGNLILSLARADGTESIRGYLATGATANVAAAALKMRGNSVTSRSINAGGTINASGADYAEYERLGKGCKPFAKGDIVGFDADGLLTDKWAKAIRFGIKSTSPSLVGGDDWADSVPMPVEPTYTLPPQFERAPYGERPYVNLQTAKIPKAEMRAGQSEWDAMDAKWKAAREAHFNNWKNTVYAAYERDLAVALSEVEDLRASVERIAYCGKVPVNVLGAIPGQYVLACKKGQGIGVQLIGYADLTFAQIQQSVGRVNRILPDGRAEVVVRVG